MCGEMPLGGLLGKGQLMALLAKILPLMEAQWLSSNSANFQWNFTYSESQNEAECLAELESFCSHCFVLQRAGVTMSVVLSCSMNVTM